MFLLSQSFYPQHDGCAHLESCELYYLSPLYSVGFKGMVFILCHMYMYSDGYLNNVGLQFQIIKCMQVGPVREKPVLHTAENSQF